MKRKPSLEALFIAVASLCLAFGASAAQADGPAKQQGGASTDVRQLRLAAATQPWKGDFDGMMERRVIRFYVPYSRSLYFVDKGRERGISAYLIREFERWVNAKYAKELGKRPISALVVVATRDKLKEDLLEGRADVAVGNIKVLDEYLKDVDFVAPDETAVSVEVLVTGPSSPAVASVDDLSGKTVHVRKTSTYHASLEALDARLKQQGKPGVGIALVPDALEDEDLMEMLNAGIVQLLVVDDWKAKAWAQLLPKLKVREDIVLRPKTKMGWAIRKGSPKLEAELNEFYAVFAKQGTIGTRVKRDFANKLKVLRNASAGEDQKRFDELITWFRKYGEQYRFDPLMLAAQGYQESQLNQGAKSRVGAIGIMQLLPATGTSLQVGDISQPENNIHAGAKYMDQLMTKYFADAKFDEQNRTLFGFASYNAGPGTIAKMRREAEARGLDPNLWFNNVEIVTAEKVGMETPTYVRNIFKYYAAYRLTADAMASAEKLKQQVAPAKK